jgi:hypothetical protein
MVLLTVAVCCFTRDARAQITVSGSPAQLTVATATAGFAPDPVSNSTTTYNVANSPGTTHYTITAQLNADMPTGVTLTITLQAGGGGSSNGAVVLSMTAQNVATGVTHKVNSDAITYQLSATAGAGVVPLQTRRVTFTAITVP